MLTANKTPNGRGHIRCLGKRIRFWIATSLILVIGLTLTSPEALAWGKKKNKKEAPKKEKAINLNQAPTMKFIQGRLSRDLHGRWQINRTPIHFTEKSFLAEKGRPTVKVQPREGHTALLMGHFMGGVFVIDRGTMQRPGSENIPESPGEDEPT